jgi:outer membrane murein-binding lipoprotein Lpp
MTTYAKGPPPGTASGGSAHPDPTPHRVVTLRKALVLGALVALLAGVLSAAGATYLAGGQTDDESQVSVDTLTAQVDDLAEQAGTLTAQVDTLTVQADSLAAEKADLTIAVADAQAQVDSLGEENAALRQQVADLAPGQQPPTAEVTFGEVSKADRPRPKGSFLLFVDVTVTNPDDVEIAWFSPDDVQLSGPEGATYKPLRQSRLRSTVQYGELEDIVLAASERVKGFLVFYVPEPVTEFTITYHGTTTALSL